MNWQSRLEKMVIALNLIGLALGFGTLGVLILVKGGRVGGSLVSGILGIVVGSLFLLFAFYGSWDNLMAKGGVVSFPPA